MLDTDTDTGARAERRLREEQIIWLTTVRPDGQPQSVPVWFYWDGRTFLIRSRPDQRKVRNLRANPRVDLNLNSDPYGGSVLRVEGTAELIDPAGVDMAPYLEKYRAGIARLGLDPEGMERAYAAAIRVTPARWQSW